MLSLHPDHLADLRRSGLTDQTITAAGIRSLAPAEWPRYLSPRLAAKIQSAYLIPYPEADGSYPNAGGFYRVKIFPPIPDQHGHSIRYYQPAGTAPHLYLPPRARAVCADPSVPLWITEGEKKALKADQEGLACAALGGLWSWLLGGKPIPDLDQVDWYERELLLGPDSDVWARQDLLRPVVAFGKNLEARGAKAAVAKLPAGPAGAKVGLDDYLCSHLVAELDALPKLALTHQVFANAAAWWEAWRNQQAKGAASQPSSAQNAQPQALWSWPDLDARALYGLAGDFVRLVAPHTEADPVSLLIHFLVMFGNVINRGPHMVVEEIPHHTNLYACFVGVTSKSRKGSSEAQTRARVRAADEHWERTRVVSGLSSGEGLIWQVRDPIEKQERVGGKGAVHYETVIADEGETDKRLTVIEPEFASTLRIMAREGNTLSPIIRQAWDRGALRSLTKNSPARATDAHISIIGHITRDELIRYLDRTEMGNGFANRFLWACVKRAQELPEGGAIGEVNLARFTRQLKEAIDFARKLGDSALVRDEQARERWRAEYGPLSAGRPGLLGAVTSRAEAQVLRISLNYALLDQSREIRLPHLEAALAVWRYCDASAAWIFGDSLGDPDADEVLALLQTKPGGVTRTEISNAFGRNLPAYRIDRALKVLLELARVRMEQQPTGGRSAQRWVAQ